MDMKQITVKAYAKINLFLEVKERLPNGYHDLESIMQSVSLCDVLHFEINDSNTFTLDCPKIDCDYKSNLIYKAAMEFFRVSGIPFAGMDVKVEKNIPSCAGLAGGSSDAAATLKALNSLYKMPFSDLELRNIGRNIGADVPFCLLGATALAKGIGEVLLPIESMPNCFIVIAIGNDGVSTKWAFEQLDGQTNRVIRTTEAIISAIKANSLSSVCREFYNVFESVSPYEKAIKEIMLKNGSLGALMSGSGPSVFGIYTDESNAKATVKALTDEGYFAFLCVQQKNI